MSTPKPTPTATTTTTTTRRDARDRETQQVHVARSHVAAHVGAWLHWAPSNVAFVVDRMRAIVQDVGGFRDLTAQHDETVHTLREGMLSMSQELRELVAHQRLLQLQERRINRSLETPRVFVLQIASPRRVSMTHKGQVVTDGFTTGCNGTGESGGRMTLCPATTRARQKASASVASV
jgi:hypothetical protein